MGFAITPDDIYATKVVLWRALVRRVEQEGLLDAVRALLPPMTHPLLLEKNTAPMGWVLLDHMILLCEALGSIGGDALVRELSASAIRTEVVPLMHSVIQGLFHLFGVSPHTLGASAPRTIRDFLRGLQMQYRKTGERSGVLTMRYATLERFSYALALAYAGGVDVIYALCEVKGEILAPRYVEGSGQRTVELLLSWE